MILKNQFTIEIKVLLQQLIISIILFYDQSMVNFSSNYVFCKRFLPCVTSFTLTLVEIFFFFFVKVILMERDSSEVWFNSLKKMLDYFAEKNIFWFEKYFPTMLTHILLPVIRNRFANSQKIQWIMLKNNENLSKNSIYFKQSLIDCRHLFLYDKTIKDLNYQPQRAYAFNN